MASWTKRTCKANGIDIYYRRTGGDKPPVVLLHGLMLNGACWTPLAQSLERDYDVVMPDARGHGHTSVPDQGYSYNNLADDVESLIAELRLAHPILLGHSMGGMTAAIVASWNSKLLSGLLLADPAFLTPERQLEIYESDVTDQHRRILSRSREDFLIEMRARHSRRSPQIMELFAQARFQTSIRAFEILTPPYPDYMQLILSLDVPNQLVIGDAGSVVSPLMAAELARLNRYLEVVQIKKAGHAVPFDQPEHFSAVVKSFFRSLNA